MSTKSKRKIPAIIGNYALGRLLGSGYSGMSPCHITSHCSSYVHRIGHIYEATHIYTGHVVALKLQDVDHECPTNSYERYLYPMLMGGKGMPTLWAAGQQEGWDYLAIDLLGVSLERLYKSVGGPEKTLDVGTVCTIAIQLVRRLSMLEWAYIWSLSFILGDSRFRDWRRCMRGAFCTVTSNWVTRSLEGCQMSELYT